MGIYAEGLLDPLIAAANGGPASALAWTGIDSDTEFGTSIFNAGSGGHLDVPGLFSVTNSGVAIGTLAVTTLNATTANIVTLNVTGNTTLGNAAGDLVTVTGTPTFQTAVLMNSTLHVVGAVFFDDAITLGTAAGDAIAVNGTPTFLAAATFNNDLTVLGNTALGNANSDTVTTIGVSTWRNAAASATQAFIDAANDRVIVGSATALTTATSDKFTVVGGRAYVSPASESLALGLRYGAAVLGQVFLGASNSATPDLIVSNAAGTQIGRFTTAGVFLAGSQATAIGTAANGDAVVNDVWLFSSGSDYRRLMAAGDTFQVSGNTDSGTDLSIDATGIVTVKSLVIDTALDPPALDGQVTPGSLVKAFGYVTAGGGASLGNSQNVFSVARNGTGDHTVTLDLDFNSSSYAVVVTVQDNSQALIVRVNGQAGGSFDVHFLDTAGVHQDPDAYAFICCGTLT